MRAASVLPFIFLLSINLFAPRVGAALSADQLVLIVNRNEPQSAKLAETYAKARQIPDGRILSLDLPNTDDISFDAYERDVVPAVRDFLRDNHLSEKVKCLVTFYGVPLRIAARENSPRDTRELQELRRADLATRQRLLAIAAELEKLASDDDPTFRPAAGESLTAIARRLDAASQSLALRAQGLPSAIDRADATKQLMSEIAKVRQPPPVLADLDDAPTTTSSPATTSVAAAPATTPTTAPASAPASGDINALISRRFDFASRQQLRALAAKDGMLSYARVLESQIEYLVPDATSAAFDSELPLVLWPSYPRTQWMPNPLNYHYETARTPPVMMTMRLDGPTAATVRDLIATSLQVEQRGLQGSVVIDSGGAAVLDPTHKNRAYWIFEQSFARLATLLKAKSKLSIVYDTFPQVLDPRSQKDVALYTGWYSVGRYVPGCVFNPGAIGFHVASYEMTSLHDVNNHGWCRGLISDGVVATPGPVAEPYLTAFPPPDELFELLLTGKLTLAEAYWKTTPLASWQMTMVGDPLYTPYQINPQLTSADLPEPLRAALESADAPISPAR